MSKIAFLRTPDDRFSDLPEWPYAPQYLELSGLYAGMRCHYIDEGPRDAAQTFLCLHGEPSWAYLYRKMIPVFLESGARVIAPDFLGFGRSDKPVDDAVYTVQFHRNMLLQFIERLELENLTLVVQDWGALIGLTIPVDMPARVSRLLLMNGAFPNGAAPPDAFLTWRQHVADHPDLDVSELFGKGRDAHLFATDSDPLTPGEMAAYDAPFPDARYKAGPRRFPQLVPIKTEGADEEVMAIGKAAMSWWSEQFSGPSFVAVGATDPVLGPHVMERLHPLFKTAPPLMRVERVGHFVQDFGAPVARTALQVWGDFPC